MEEIILGFLLIHCLICVGLAVGDLIYGWKHGYDINNQFILHTLIGAFIWPVGLLILLIWNISRYLRKK